MHQRDGTIVSTGQVEPSNLIVNTVKKMFDVGVVEKTVVERITYLSDGLKINGYAARPSEPGEYPVLIWNRGGSGDRGALDDMTSYLILASTAVWGYVVLASQYRGNKGSEGEEDWGRGDIRDSLNLINVAEQYPECDTSRMAVEGASRGGMVTYRELGEDHRFKCAVIHAGVTDIVRLCQKRNEYREYLNTKFEGFCAEDRRAEYESRSPVKYVDKLSKKIPILIMHGNEDRVVPLEQSQLMVEELERRHIPHEFKVIEGGGHVSLKDGSYREIDRYRKAWLAEHLG